MEQTEILDILNRHIFNDDKIALLTAVAKTPDRFVGLFRSTTPPLKLMQNLLQSREIRFGDALEEIMTRLIQDIGFISLDKRLLREDEEDLSCDQYFCDQDRQHFYLMEQKVRDDHDSTKKRGQVNNFKAKINHLKQVHGNRLTAIMYFIDPSLHKNEGYYKAELTALQTEMQIPIHLFYNGDFFDYLQRNQLWNLLVNSLELWRKNIPQQITLNYDLDTEKTLSELKTLSVGIWRKLIVNEALWSGGVINTLFPNGSTLYALESQLRIKSIGKRKASKTNIAYLQLAEALNLKMKKYYPTHSDLTEHNWSVIKSTGQLGLDLDQLASDDE
jgi:hypothetical protein